MSMENITLWDGQTIPRLGFGCWAIGGPFWADAIPVGWGVVDDNESKRAIQVALDAGIRFFDTADVYGAGHSEKVLGEALKGHDDIIVATKFGNQFDEDTKQVTGRGADRAYIRKAVQASLRRLNRDYIDLYQLHIDDLDGDDAQETQSALEELVSEGLIRAYGWSSDYPDHSKQWLGGKNYRSIQHDLNLFTPATETLALVEENDMVSINRAPLAMGMLSGNYKLNHSFGEDDVRSSGTPWMKKMGSVQSEEEAQTRLEGIRELLTTGGRTTAQGALGWIWAQSDRALPIPGFRTEAQAHENAGALEFGPLDVDVLHEIDELVKGNFS
ncbi:aldo/keto reductase [Maritalea myrionectae]|uniref:aldo/keto reductase n=1 Tax=Maritalea myrionectae TaxID=454601 RepID=UPI000483E315